MAINTRFNTFGTHGEPAPPSAMTPPTKVICFEWGMNLNRNVVLVKIYVSIAKGFCVLCKRDTKETLPNEDEPEDEQGKLKKWVVAVGGGHSHSHAP